MPRQTGASLDSYSALCSLHCLCAHACWQDAASRLALPLLFVVSCYCHCCKLLLLPEDCFSPWPDRQQQQEFGQDGGFVGSPWECMPGCLISGGGLSKRGAFNLQRSSADLLHSQELLWDEVPLRNTQDLPCIFELAPPKSLQQSLDVSG